MNFLVEKTHVDVLLVRDPRYPGGGAETWVETIAAGLPRHGCNVVLFVPTNSREEASGIQSRFLQAEVRSVSQSDDPVLQAEYLLQGVEELTRSGRNGIYFTMMYPYVNIAGLNLIESPFLPIPVMHGRHWSAFDWMCSGPPKAIVVPSSDFAKTCQHELTKRIGRLRSIGRVKAIPHGVQLPDAYEIFAKRRAQSANIRIVVLSRLDPDTKRPLDYVRIALELSRRGIGFEMRIAGDGPSFAEMSCFVSANGLADRVVLLGTVAHAQINSQLKWGDILISTSESEAFGLSVAEGLAFGCVPITTDIPGPTQELVGEPTGFRVPVGDICAFADRIETLAADRTIIEKLSIEGRQLVARKFSADIMLNRYAVLIEELKSACAPNRHWRVPDDISKDPGQWARKRRLSRRDRYLKWMQL